ncbi:MAG TPA: hypothetical protein VMT44_02795 [Methanoregula sp.]|nr:hypothetical protein [Methanoregula sp.]
MNLKTNLILLCLLCAALALAMPAHGDPIENTITKIFVEDRGRPVDDFVNFSMNCHGSLPEWWPRRLDDSPNASGTDLVFHYSIDCQPEGCAIYDPYDTWMMKIISCDVNGSYKGTQFLFRNFSGDPQPECYSIMNADSEDNELRGVYDIDDNNCFEIYENSSRLCGKLFDINGNDTEYDAYRQCTDRSQTELSACKTRNSQPIRVNKTELLSYPIGAEPTRYCELMFDLHPVNGAAVHPIFSHASGIAHRSPVESLYCSLLSFFGAEC